MALNIKWKWKSKPLRWWLPWPVRPPSPPPTLLPRVQLRNRPLPQVVPATRWPVKKGDKLLMYEAMKMENNLLAEADGTITAINCRQGDNVLQGDTLIVIG